MKRKRRSLLVLGLGVFSLTLSGCTFKEGWESTISWMNSHIIQPIKNLFIKDKGQEEKPDLVIPTVDVESLEINLPSLPERNVGAIRSDDEYEYLDVYELSDFHGAVNYEAHSSGDYIGLPKLATYFDGRRSENAGGTLILSSGDMFQGSADSNLTRGFMVNYCMQYMGFDAMAIGNHEFDWTDEWIKKNAELKYNTTSVPYLGANILKNGEIPDFLTKSTIVNRGEYKVGVIGVIGNDLESSILKSCIENYEFVKYADIVSTEAARLKSEEGCNAVVLLAHEGAENVEKVSGVDAIFGGHAHQDKQDYGQGIPAVATKNYGQSVAHIELKFNKSDKSLVGATDEIVSMSNYRSLEENASISSIMDQYAPEINKIKNIRLGSSDFELRYDKALKNICTRSMFDSAVDVAKKVDTIDESKIVISLHNVNGGIRDNIAAGEITYGNVYKSFPFDNEIVLIKVTGEEFVSKIANLRHLGCYKIFEKREYFKPDENYYIVTTDYLALSESEFGNNFKHLEDKDLIRTGLVVRDEVAAKIYKVDKVTKDQFENNDPNYSQVSISF